jgi:hypothetical protein
MPPDSPHTIRYTFIKQPTALEYTIVAKENFGNLLSGLSGMVIGVIGSFAGLFSFCEDTIEEYREYKKEKKTGKKVYGRMWLKMKACSLMECLGLINLSNIAEIVEMTELSRSRAKDLSTTLEMGGAIKPGQMTHVDAREVQTKRPKKKKPGLFKKKKPEEDARRRSRVGSMHRPSVSMQSAPLPTRTMDGRDPRMSTVGHPDMRRSGGGTYAPMRTPTTTPPPTSRPVSYASNPLAGGRGGGMGRSSVVVMAGPSRAGSIRLPAG